LTSNFNLRRGPFLITVSKKKKSLLSGRRSEHSRLYRWSSFGFRCEEPAFSPVSVGQQQTEARRKKSNSAGLPTPTRGAAKPQLARAVFPGMADALNRSMPRLIHNPTLRCPCHGGRVACPARNRGARHTHRIRPARSASFFWADRPEARVARMS